LPVNQRDCGEKELKRLMSDRELKELVDYIVSATKLPQDHVIKVLIYERRFYLGGSAQE